MMDDCLFCKIASGVIAPDTVFEDDEILAFKDINPVAPVHILIIPKVHIATINDLDEAHRTLIGKMHLVASQIAADNDLAESGYRLVFNCNGAAGQTVFHIHLHLLGGRDMTWPPG
jgi:histidine triad (HIT) family protein